MSEYLLANNAVQFARNLSKRIAGSFRSGHDKPIAAYTKQIQCKTEYEATGGNSHA
jgi:hypothetical protein